MKLSAACAMVLFLLVVLAGCPGKNAPRGMVAGDVRPATAVAATASAPATATVRYWPIRPETATTRPTLAPLPRLEFEGASLSKQPLPAGEVSIAGVDWSLPAGKTWTLDAGATAKPPAITGITVGRRANRLHFLHALHAGRGIADWRLAAAVEKRKLRPPPAPPVVMRYIVHYADGQTLAIPVRWGESIEHWYRVGVAAPMLWATPVTLSRIDPLTTEQIVFYAMDWPNPRPEVPIASIDIVSGNLPWLDYGRPVVLGITASTLPRSGRDFYVAPAPAGDDAAPGTFDRPWESLAKAFESLCGGDTLYIRGGVWPITRKLVLPSSGQENAWITITAFPGETPVIDGLHSRLDPKLYPPHSPPPYDHDLGLIHMMGQSFVRVRGLTVANSRRAGISAYGLREKRSQFIDFSFNTVDRCFGMGILVHGVDHVTINNNVVVKANTPQMHFETGGDERMTLFECPQEEIDLSGNSFYEVAYNEIYGGEKEAIDTISTDRGSIHHNYIHQNISGIYIDSWTRKQYDIEVYANWMQGGAGISVSNEGAGSIQNIGIHHNVLFGLRNQGISVGEASYKARPARDYRDIRVYNNTIWRCGYPWVRGGWNGAGLQFGSGHGDSSQMRDMVVRNNIVADNAELQIASVGFADLKERNILVDHNLVSPADDRRTAQVKARDRRQPVIGEAPVLADPMFRNPEYGDFGLRPGSPAIDAANPADQYNDPDGSRGDLGALPARQKLLFGLDPCGRVLLDYPGAMRFEPVEIPARLLNIRLDRLREAEGWFFRGIYGDDIRDLPEGEQAMAGVVWRIRDSQSGGGRGAIALKSIGSQAMEDTVRGIPVGRKADRLYFLHTYNRGPALAPRRPSTRPATAPATAPADPVVFHYIVHYADGQQATIPVQWRTDIEFWRQGGAPGNLPGADVAWTIRTSYRGGGYARLALYSMPWDNPRPGVVVQSIDVVSNNTADTDYGSPAILAITAATTLANDFDRR